MQHIFNKSEFGLCLIEHFLEISCGHPQIMNIHLSSIRKYVPFLKN